MNDADEELMEAAESGAKVVAKIEGQEIGTATVNAEGKFTMTIAKQVAGVKIAVTATDEAGNVSAAAEITVSDVTAPAAPVVNGDVNDNDLVIKGTAEAGATVSAQVNGQEIGKATATAEGEFTYDYS